MPLDIRSQVVTALDNINRNPELYTPPKLTTPLETRINDLKETNPNKYREYISTLTSSANSGNEEARELLGKIGEDAARQRRGYEGLNTAMYAPAIIGAGALAAPSVSWIYSQLPKWVKTGIDIGLTVDGARNFFSDNGWQKTKRELVAGNYKDAILSGMGDTLDVIGSTSLTKRIGKGLITRVGNRNIYTYNNISPASYKFSAHKKEILPWFKDFILNKIDLNPKYTLSDELGNFVSAKNATEESKIHIAKIGRDEAWRKYLGIESKYPVFIPNHDGSVSYNMSYLKSLLKPENPKLPTDFQIKSFEDGIKRDFITGAFGGVDQNVGINKLSNSTSKNISRNSLLPNRHPYFRYRYLSPQELKNYSTIVSSKANDTFTAIDGIERYGRYHMRNTWDLQPFKDKNNSTARILSRILPTKWSNYEIGKILGGKPFTLNTYIDYSDKFYKGYFRGPYDKSWKRNYQDFKPGL